MHKRRTFMTICISAICFLSINITCQTKPKTTQKLTNELTFSSADIDMKDFQLTYIEAVKHTMSTAGRQYTAMVIHLANYDRSGHAYHPNPKEEGWRRVTISFSAPSGQSLKACSYSLDGGMAKDFRLSVGIEKMGKSTGLYNGTGTGEILFIDDKTITARVNVQDEKGTTIKAEFTTPWETSRY